MVRRLRREDYTVGWVCALPVELAAAQEMLDEEHSDPECDMTDNDENLYVLGSISGHHIAIGCLPAGQIGNNPAAIVAMQMRATFKRIRFGLMVGIGGGVPSVEADIRLGDVVISQPHRTFAGVVQYDSGKTTLHGFERTGSLNSPPQILLAAVARVRANELRSRSKFSEHVSKLERIAKFQRSKAGPDILFQAAYDHEAGQTCDGCDLNRQEARSLRDSGEEIVMHYGTIASGSQVIRNATERDNISAELGGVLCFEMEAAGLMNSFPCLVIRGICDYADSHKNKRWQAYAAGTAAAYAKEVLSVIPPAEVAKTHTVEEMTLEEVGTQKKREILPSERVTALPLDGRTSSSDEYGRVLPEFGRQPCIRENRSEEAVKKFMEIKNHGSWFTHRTHDENFRSDQAGSRCTAATTQGSAVYPCRTCPKTFATQSATNEHMVATGHGNPSVGCKSCAKKFYTQAAANEHMAATGHVNPGVPCRMCPKKFFTQNAANEHMTAIGHWNLSFPCRKCAKKFSTRSAAHEHMTAVRH